MAGSERRASVAFQFPAGDQVIMKKRLGALTAAMVDKALPLTGFDDDAIDFFADLRKRKDAEKQSDLRTIGGTE